MGSGPSNARLKRRRWPDTASALTTTAPPPSSSTMPDGFGGWRWPDSEVWTDIYVVRCAAEALTADARRQAISVGRRFLSRRIAFHSVFSSPWHAAKLTASFICQELNIGQESIELGEALSEMSHGTWAGTLGNEAMNTKELLTVMYNLHQDFHAPGGETQRQVEFRMIEFVNDVILKRANNATNRIDSQTYFVKHGPSTPLMQVQRPLEGVDDDSSNTCSIESSSKLTKSIENAKIHTSTISSDIHVNDVNFDRAQALSPYNVLVVSHEMAIKCLLRGILGSTPQMTNNICIDNASITILRHSTHMGWRIVRVNDTSHLY